MPREKNIEDLPKGVEDFPKHAKRIYLKAHNNALEQYKDPKKRRGEASLEEVAHKVAWAAVKKEYVKEKKKRGMDEKIAERAVLWTKRQGGKFYFSADQSLFLALSEPNTCAIGFNHSTSSQIIFTLVRIGTARKTPGIPHIHPQNRIAPNTTMGLMVKCLPRIMGVMKYPSSPAKQK